MDYTLPTDLNVISDIEDKDERIDYICEYLSDEYGFCVCEFDEVSYDAETGVSVISEIEWDVSDEEMEAA